MGNQQNTLHALNPRLTSSTHWSSNVIQRGRFSSENLLGLTFSQKSSAVICLKVLTGFNDHRPFMAERQRRMDFPKTEPVGGERMYMLRPAKSTKGQRRKTTVGRV